MAAGNEDKSGSIRIESKKPTNRPASSWSHFVGRCCTMLAIAVPSSTLCLFLGMAYCRHEALNPENLGSTSLWPIVVFANATQLSTTIQFISLATSISWGHSASHNLDGKGQERQDKEMKTGGRQRVKPFQSASQDYSSCPTTGGEHQQLSVTSKKAKSTPHDDHFLWLKLLWSPPGFIFMNVTWQIAVSHFLNLSPYTDSAYPIALSYIISEILRWIFANFLIRCRKSCYTQLVAASMEPWPASATRTIQILTQTLFRSTVMGIFLGIILAAIAVINFFSLFLGNVFRDRLWVQIAITCILVPASGASLRIFVRLAVLHLATGELDVGDAAEEMYPKAANSSQPQGDLKPKVSEKKTIDNDGGVEEIRELMAFSAFFSHLIHVLGFRIVQLTGSNLLLAILGFAVSKALEAVIRWHRLKSLSRRMAALSTPNFAEQDAKRDEEKKITEAPKEESAAAGNGLLPAPGQHLPRLETKEETPSANNHHPPGTSSSNGTAREDFVFCSQSTASFQLLNSTASQACQELNSASKYSAITNPALIADNDKAALPNSSKSLHADSRGKVSCSAGHKGLILSTCQEQQFPSEEELPLHSPVNCPRFQITDPAVQGQGCTKTRQYYDKTASSIGDNYLNIGGRATSSVLKQEPLTRNGESNKEQKEPKAPKLHKFLLIEQNLLIDETANHFMSGLLASIVAVVQVSLNQTYLESWPVHTSLEFAETLVFFVCISLLSLLKLFVLDAITKKLPANIAAISKGPPRLISTKMLAPVAACCIQGTLGSQLMMQVALYARLRRQAADTDS